ncbi:hypothetical protein SRDD_40250 [Serratia sp. DD3]|nr:hypothetical protein SRDD_40250 [Serratia sp. DD3]
MLAKRTLLKDVSDVRAHLFSHAIPYSEEAIRVEDEFINVDRAIYY